MNFYNLGLAQNPAFEKQVVGGGPRDWAKAGVVLAAILIPLGLLVSRSKANHLRVAERSQLRKMGLPWR